MKKLMMKSNYSVVITGAGKSTRFKSQDKLLILVREKPVIVHTLTPFLSDPFCKQIILVANKDNYQQFKKLFNPSLVTIIKVNTTYRAESVFLGLKLVNNKKVLIHDGARFNITNKIIKRVVKGLENSLASVPIINPTSTISYYDKKTSLHQIIDRKSVFLHQTPQGFKTDLLYKIMEQNDLNETDSASFLIKNKIKITFVKGCFTNIKLTTQSDLKTFT